jgi:hypothetical protein
MALVLDTPESGSCTRRQAFDSRLIPEATTTYQPLPNKEFIGMIERVAKMNGLTLVDEQLGLDLKGMRLFGVVGVEGKDFFNGRIKLEVGFCNSYNRSMSARVCIGGKVFVCSNRAFHAYSDELTGTDGMTIHRHHPWLSDGLFGKIKEAFDSLEDFRRTQEDFYGRLEETRITRDRAYSLIIRAAKRGVINKTRVLTVVEEWDRQGKEPRDEKQAEEWDWHREFMDRNAFNLFNAFTEVEKARAVANPNHSNIETMALTKFFYMEYFRKRRN